jgi:aspartyl-tRNA(Asn)/glutamyl-tRNA(Gln) amidotransferase subunit A
MGKTGIDLVNATLTEMSELLRTRKISPVELVEATLQRIEDVGSKLNCFVTVTGDYALERAKQAEREISAGKYRGPMHGITYTLKDGIDTKGIRTTHANLKGLDLKPKVSSSTHTLLEEAGSILVGKVKIDVRAFQSSDTAKNRPVSCVNPWDTNVSPGTSSSGSGSATAASLCLSSVGTDGGGSVRHPAANCGIVGFRATTGRISRYPIDSFPTASASQAGPMTKTVEDNAIMLQVIGRYDPKDPISINEPPEDYRSRLRDGIKGVRIGVPVDDWIWKEWVTEEHEDRVRDAIKLLEQLGAYIVEVSLPLAVDSRALMDGIEPEGLWWDEQSHLFENIGGWDELLAMIEVGKSRQLDVADYADKARKRLLVRQELVSGFKEVDIIAMPTGMTLGDSPGLKTTMLRGREVITRSRAMYLNGLASITGFPALSVPCGFAVEDRLPVGLQLMGRTLEESLIYRAAYAYEQATDWHLRHPPL